MNCPQKARPAFVFSEARTAGCICIDLGNSPCSFKICNKLSEFNDYKAAVGMCAREVLTSKFDWDESKKQHHCHFQQKQQGQVLHLPHELLSQTTCLAYPSDVDCVCSCPSQADASIFFEDEPVASAKSKKSSNKNSVE
jgi:hypothetical protein